MGTNQSPWQPPPPRGSWGVLPPVLVGSRPRQHPSACVPRRRAGWFSDSTGCHRTDHAQQGRTTVGRHSAPPNFLAPQLGGRPTVVLPTMMGTSTMPTDGPVGAKQNPHHSPFAACPSALTCQSCGQFDSETGFFWEPEIELRVHAGRQRTPLAAGARADLAVPVELVHNCNQAPALPAHGLPLALKLVNKPQKSASVQSGAGTGWLRKGTACLPTTQT